MSFQSTKKVGGGDFANPTPGMVSAVCTRVIDMGTQESQWGPKRRVLVSWEIDEQMDDGRPFMVSSSFTLSFHEKAALIGMLESWRGKAYAEGESIDLSGIVGRPAMLNLVESQGANGNTYVNVKSVSPLPKGMSPLAPAGELTILNLDDPNWDAFNALSERLQEKIMASPEYRQAMGMEQSQKNPPGPGPTVQAAPKTEKSEAMAMEFDDDIPF